MKIVKNGVDNLEVGARQNRKFFVNLSQSLWGENVTLWESKCTAAN